MDVYINFWFLYIGYLGNRKEHDHDAFCVNFIC